MRSPGPPDAEAWARTVVRALNTPWPWAAAHVASGPDDCDVTPARLHPAFSGCLDWHSSVHMLWSALVLLDVAGPALTPPTRAALCGVLDERLTPSNAAVEAAYLRAHPGFERPYGWGWALALAAAASGSAQPGASGWARAASVVAEPVWEHLLDWLPRQRYPVRSGVHDNTAFGLVLAWDAAGALGRPDAASAIASRARDWFVGDAAYPVAWEPSGQDFVSAALSEAVLLRRVLAADEFPGWLNAFLPGLGAAGDPLLDALPVTDTADGKLAHLNGLALSRAWHLRELAAHLDADRRVRVLAAERRAVDAVTPLVASGDYMSTHWLVTFALKAWLAEPA